MQNDSFKVLFYLRKAKTNSRGLTPLQCRITLNKKRKEFSTGYFVFDKDWDASTQLIISKSTELKTINTQLNQISQLFIQIFNTLLLEKEAFDVNDIYNRFKGNNEKNVVYLSEYFEGYLKRLKLLVGIDMKNATWKKHENAFVNLKGFIVANHRGKDLKLQDIDLLFIKEYEFYLKTERKFSQATVNKVLQRFKKMLSYTLEQKEIEQHSFAGYKFSLQKREVVYLTPNELKLLEKSKPKAPRLALVKDLFIFCCYTGLAFNEMDHLKQSNIEKGFDGKLWISLEREKTHRQLAIPILPKAKVILEKYKSEDDKVFPKISNQKFNAYLKEVADIAGIEKNLTHHIARKTFASTVLLYNDVLLETVSELLGHSSIKVTQESYAKQSNKKVSETMIRLSKILK